MKTIKFSVRLRLPFKSEKASKGLTLDCYLTLEIIFKKGKLATRNIGLYLFFRILYTS